MKIPIFQKYLLDDLENQAISRFTRDINKLKLQNIKNSKEKIPKNKNKTSFTLELNNINLDFDYNKLTNIDRIYVPIKYFTNKKYNDILNILKNKGNLYISLPIIVRDNYRNITFNFLGDFIKSYDVKGIVVTNVASREQFSKYDKLEIVANHSLNVFNLETINSLKELGFDTITLSPELNKNELKFLADNSSLSTELMVYGRLPLMSTGYCFLGKSNRCYPTCNMPCKESSYHLRDRLGYNFKIVPDNMQTITTIYNSKILSIDYSDINIDYAKISILDEDIDTINEIISSVKSNKVIKGSNYTSGNLNRKI